MNGGVASTAARPAARRWTWFAWLSTWLLAVYLAIVLPVDRLVPAINDWRTATFLLLSSFVLGYLAFRRLAALTVPAEEWLKNVTVLCGMSLFAFVSADMTFKVYTNVAPKFQSDLDGIFDQRWLDEHVWDGELMPVPYQPTSANFLVYKPGQVRTATVHGEHYYPALARHAILRDSVLELHRIEVSIDRYGLRNTDDPTSASIFTLGDSFCFGDQVTQSRTFSELLKSKLGEPVYNMGVVASSPMEQFLLFDHMLRTYPDTFKPKRLLWLLFEGNDLFETYERTRQSQPASRTLRDALADTLIGVAADIPALLRRQSIIRRLSDGELALGRLTREQAESSHFNLDGETLMFPLYRSDRFGPSLFLQAYLDQAAQTELDVVNHPNWPRLVNLFGEMKALAEEHGFAVTVVTVPTNARLYGDYFEDFPPVADRPYFIEKLTELADDVGFEHVDLAQLLTPYAAKELIYHRDDTHWNERGHEIVADLLAKEVFATKR